MTYTFGPVPSRRLGRSLGVNNIPPQHCTYACVYCQLGDPQRVSTRRREFYPPPEVIASVRDRMEDLARTGEAPPDYITIVPDGEPTLDRGLGELVSGLRDVLVRRVQTSPGGGAPPPEGVATARGPAAAPRIAVITNGSLLSDAAVRAALAPTDWVSVKIDAAEEAIWRRIDRPARDLDFEAVLAGIAAFAGEFNGTLASETMLVAGLNDEDAQLAAIAARVVALPRPDGAATGAERPSVGGGGAPTGPDVAYLSVPTRPPAVGWVAPPEEERILAAYRIFTEAGLAVELNTGYEAGEFSAGDDVAGGILAIGAVHPIERSALEDLLARSGATWSVVEALLGEGRLLEKEYRGRRFYVTRLRRR